MRGCQEGTCEEWHRIRESTLYCLRPASATFCTMVVSGPPLHRCPTAYSMLSRHLAEHGIHIFREQMDNEKQLT
ncbi:hypothetical protein QJS10_CPB13g00934 [Acorus calamus]|uniref:Uncharacterized protein n=1 Tax=Acorus calamus TaxID=4465 RepID=A0AAV9DIZ2_ACOCL|nr:hypothetical protein QJS10_CPB13g00934 [Acorus calamus]